MKIGVYGGSFNPPHLGHVRAARACKEALGLDRVLVIPASIPPHKQMASGSATAMERLKLTQLAFSQLPGFAVLDMELRREGTQLYSTAGTKFKKLCLQNKLNLLDAS